MTTLLNYLKDLEDSFKLDCSSEDLKIDDEAKRCYKQLKKLRSHTKKHINFLYKFGFMTKWERDRLWK